MSTRTESFSLGSVLTGGGIFFAFVAMMLVLAQTQMSRESFKIEKTAEENLQFQLELEKRLQEH